MTYVADEQLGKIARQQADLFRRVHEGSLDVEYVSRGLQHIIERKYPGNAYLLFVDYGKSVEDGVKAGRYNWSNPNITSKNFPTKRKGTAVVEVELVHFNRYIWTAEILHKLDKMGCRPAELHELLAFGEKHPEAQQEFPVIALGSVWRDRNGHRNVPYLYEFGSKRLLGLDWIEEAWIRICRFAAVRK